MLVSKIKAIKNGRVIVKDSKMKDGVGGLYNNFQEWQQAAKQRGYTVRQSVHPSGSGIQYNAKTSEGNERGTFDPVTNKGTLDSKTKDERRSERYGMFLIHEYIGEGLVTVNTPRLSGKVEFKTVQEAKKAIDNKDPRVMSLLNKDSKTKDGSLDEIIRNMAREKADVPHNDDGTIRTPQQAQLAYEQWYKIIKSRYKNDSRYSAEYGDSKTKDASYFAKGDKIIANVSVQGMTEGNAYTVIELDHGKWGTVNYKLQDESGKTLWVNNLPIYFPSRVS